MRPRLFGRAFEGELWEGGIGRVVAKTGVVKVDGRFLDRGYDKVANSGDVATTVEFDPDGILPLVGTELTGDRGGDGVWWDVA